jgi:hypothetical protein
MKRSRWLDWRPRILGDSAENEPTKPTKPGSVGFVGANSGICPEILVPCATESAGILAGLPDTEPSKPTKPGSVGFEGASSAESPKIRATSWAEWKAAMLNRLFQEQGRTGQPGRITAATVQHGERKRSTK